MPKVDPLVAKKRGFFVTRATHERELAALREAHQSETDALRDRLLESVRVNRLALGHLATLHASLEQWFTANYPAKLTAEVATVQLPASDKAILPV